MMITAVSLLYEPWRGRRCHVVRWHGLPDPRTGKQKKHGRTFNSLHTAKIFQAEKIAEISRGDSGEPVTITLGELVEQFKCSRLSRLSYASRTLYLATIAQLLAYFDADQLVRTIEQRHAEAFISSRTRCDGKGQLASWSLTRHLIHCKAIFGAAVAWGFIKHNSFRVDRNSGSSPLRFKPKSRPWQEITAAEFIRFLSVIPDARRRILYLLMYACGLRPGEVYNLTVANVDLKTRRIHIRNRAATADVPPFTVKADHQSAAGKERFVPIPEALIPDLVAVMATALKSGGFLALTPERYQLMKKSWRLCREGNGWAHHGSRPWQNRDMVNNCLRDAKHFFKRAGVEMTAPFTLSSFRKSFAQGLAGCGVPPKTLAHLLGHSDTRITMEFYNRVTDENTRAAGETMNRLLVGEEDVARKLKKM